MVRFRAPAVDLQRLAENVRRVADLEKGLDATIAQLAIDMPGNAEAVAAAGISFRAQINRSASMIELGTAAVDALRRGGYLAPLVQGKPHWVAPPGSEPDTVAAAECENCDVEQYAPKKLPDVNPDIPDDWAE